MIRLIYALYLVILVALVALPALAQVTNISSKFDGGNLVFYKVSDGAVLATVKPTGLDVEAAKLLLGGTAVTATATEVNQYTVHVNMADAGTAGSVFVVVPHAGTIKKLSVVNQVTSTTTKTVFLAKIGGVSVTAPAWEEALDAAAGTKVTVVPTAANVVAADSVLEFASDGGTDATMPVALEAVIERD